jgi:hypothetical protein
MRREWLPFELHKFGILALVLISFSISNHLSHESGLLAVTVFGIWLANQDDLEIDSVLEFKEDLSMILISTLFILLAARLQLSDLMMLDSSVFALSMIEAGVADAEKMVPLIFTVIIVTVVLQSLTAIPVAKLLGVRQPSPNTILIIGANHVSRAIARGLKEQNIPVHLSDPAWENCKMARMDGLPCYYGNPQSEHAERYLPLTTIRSVLALSPNRHHNALGVQYFSHLLNEKNVFSLRSSSSHAKANKDSATFLSRQILFGENGAYARLSSVIAKGGKVSATRISEEFSWQQYLEMNPEAIPLFILKGDKDSDEDAPVKMRPFTSDMEKPPQEGERVVALQPPKISLLKDPANNKAKDNKKDE